MHSTQTPLVANLKRLSQKYCERFSQELHPERSMLSDFNMYHYLVSILIILMLNMHLTSH
jgi:hypothetical protein